MISGIVYLLSYYLLCIGMLFASGVKTELLELKKSFRWYHYCTCLICIGVFLLVVMYSTGRNHFVYFWDYAGYWKSSIGRMKFFEENSFYEGLIQLIESINNDDYNIYLSSVVALPLMLFGYTFRRYVILNCILFLLPSYCVVALIASKLTQNPSKKVISFSVALIIETVLASNYYAAFLGYIDVGYLLPIAIVMYAFVSYDFDKIEIGKNISIAVMLDLAWICRRYVIYFVIAFVATLALSMIVEIVLKRDLRAIKYCLINYMMIGIISGGLILIFFRVFLLRAMTGNYGEMYSAYDGPLADKILSLAQSFGYITALLTLITGVVCIYFRQYVKKYFLLLIMISLEVIVFWQTQIMGIHHKMIINIPLVVMLVLPIIIFLNEEPNGRRKRFLEITCICLALIQIANFARAFSPVQIRNDSLHIWSDKYHPQVRNDIEALYELADTLNALTVENNARAYIAASGVILNDDILKKLAMPYTEEYTKNLMYSPAVDLRDGFNRDFLFASYIVATDPVETHLASGQEMVKYLSTSVQDSNSPIGKHYTLLKEVHLDNGVTAKIYARESGYMEEDLQAMRDYFDSIYPDYHEMFSDRIYL